MNSRLFYRQLAGQISEFGTSAANRGCHRIEPLLGLFSVQRQEALFAAWFRSGVERLTCAGQGVALIVDELLDAQCELYFFTPIEPLAGPALVRFQAGKLGFPKTQHVRFDSADPRHVADAKVEPVGNFGGRRDALLGGMCCHPNLHYGVFQMSGQTRNELKFLGNSGCLESTAHSEV